MVIIQKGLDEPTNKSISRLTVLYFLYYENTTTITYTKIVTISSHLCSYARYELNITNTPHARTSFLNKM